MNYERTNLSTGKLYIKSLLKELVNASATISFLKN